MKYVKLNPKANIFHDAGTGLTVLRGQVKSISEIQSRTGKIKNAIASGHLLYTDKPADMEEVEGASVEVATPVVDVDLLVTEFKRLVSEGVVVDKIAKAFNLDKLKAIAEYFEIEIEDGDTKADIAQAIMDEVSE